MRRYMSVEIECYLPADSELTTDQVEKSLENYLGFKFDLEELDICADIEEVDE